MEDIDGMLRAAKEAQAQADDSAELDPETVARAQEQINEMLENMKLARQNQGIAIHPMVYFVAFVLIFTTVGFFAYKLVKSLQDKEKKREEKRKLKELKKKK